MEEGEEKLDGRNRSQGDLALRRVCVHEEHAWKAVPSDVDVPDLTTGLRGWHGAVITTT